MKLIRSSLFLTTLALNSSIANANLLALCGPTPSLCCLALTTDPLTTEYVLEVGNQEAYYEIVNGNRVQTNPARLLDPVPASRSTIPSEKIQLQLNAGPARRAEIPAGKVPLLINSGPIPTTLVHVPKYQEGPTLGSFPSDQPSPLTPMVIDPSHHYEFEVTSTGSTKYLGTETTIPYAEVIESGPRQRISRWEQMAMKWSRPNPDGSVETGINIKEIKILNIDEDYYEILQVDRSADNKDLIRAYRKLALRYHPDFEANRNSETQLKFDLAVEAYDILSNPYTRAFYDSFYDLRKKQQRGIPAESNQN